MKSRSSEAWKYWKYQILLKFVRTSYVILQGFALKTPSFQKYIIRVPRDPLGTLYIISLIIAPLGIQYKLGP